MGLSYLTSELLVGNISKVDSKVHMLSEFKPRLIDGRLIDIRSVQVCNDPQRQKLL
jgi:hypothetical protein